MGWGGWWVVGGGGDSDTVFDMNVSPYTPMSMQLIRVAGQLRVRIPATPHRAPPTRAVANQRLCIITGTSTTEGSA